MIDSTFDFDMQYLLNVISNCSFIMVDFSIITVYVRSILDVY